MSLMILIADSKWLFYATLRKKIATETTMAVIHQTSLALFAAIGLQCKKYFQDLFICQINFIIIYLVQITYYFEFPMVKLIYFIILTHFFQFNQLKILRQPMLLTFLS